MRLTGHAQMLARLDDALALRLKQESLSEEEQRAQGFTHYIWRTQGDEKVRPEHAANDGQVFAWDAPPPTGHPGADMAAAAGHNRWMRRSLCIRWNL